jgi:hypothetical protein
MIMQMSSATQGRSNMNWTNHISYFFGGAFFANAIPHIVSGIMGRPFQSPFAKPSGEGLSSSTVNVVWGFFNAIVAYLLIVHVGAFDLHSIPDILTMGMGAFLIALYSARHFGKFHGGNSPAP